MQTPGGSETEFCLQGICLFLKRFLLCLGFLHVIDRLLHFLGLAAQAFPGFLGGLAPASFFGLELRLDGFFLSGYELCLVAPTAAP